MLRSFVPFRAFSFCGIFSFTLFDYATVTKHIPPEAIRNNMGKADATYQIIGAQTRRNCSIGAALEWLAGKLLGVGMGWWSYTSLLARNLTLNSDTAINYNYIYSVTKFHFLLTLFVYIYLTVYHLKVVESGSNT